MRNTKREYDFYFTHNPYFPKNLYGILRDGYIKLGKDVPEKNRVFGGYQPLDDIYGSIYFDDLLHKQRYWGKTMIVINPNILEDYDLEFRYNNWGGNGETMNIHPKDTNKIFWNKIDTIHNYLKNKDQNVILGDGRVSFRTLELFHEVLFNKKISVRKYVSAIICDFLNDYEFNKVKKIIKEKKYKIKLIRRDENEPKVLTTKELL